MFYLFKINKKQKICDKIIIQQQQWVNGYSRSTSINSKIVLI